MSIELFRDPLWQFIGAALALLATVLAAFFEWKRRQKRELSYFIVARRAFAREFATSNRIQVTFDSRLVTNVRIVDFGVVNTGNQPILREDFTSPISGVFGEGAEVLSIEPIMLIPSNIEVRIRWRNELEPCLPAGALLLDPTLLNPKDAIILRCIVAGATHLKLSARIVGIHSLTPMNVLQAYIAGTET